MRKRFLSNLTLRINKKKKDATFGKSKILNGPNKWELNYYFKSEFTYKASFAAANMTSHVFPVVFAAPQCFCWRTILSGPRTNFKSVSGISNFGLLVSFTYPSYIPFWESPFLLVISTRFPLQKRCRKRQINTFN